MTKLRAEDISKTLKEKVDPVLEKHYGGAILTGFEDGVATVKMTGACATCPSAQDTINDVIKEILCSEHDEIKDVAMDTSVDEELLNFAKELLNKNIKI
ncbi:MAG: NifU family protein [Anaerovoracaceae bacterium]